MKNIRNGAMNQKANYWIEEDYLNVEEVLGKYENSKIIFQIKRNFAPDTKLEK